MRFKGACKWFNAIKGYGFVTPEGGGDDLFVHQVSALLRKHLYKNALPMRAIQENLGVPSLIGLLKRIIASSDIVSNNATQLNIKTDGFRSLRDGEPVEYDLEEGEDGKNKAVNVTGPDGAPPQGALPPRQDQFGMSMMQMMGNQGRGSRGGPPMLGGRYGPGSGPGPRSPHQGQESMGQQASSSGGYYGGYGPPPGPPWPPDARPFYVDYYIPGGGGGYPEASSQGRGRGDPGRRMTGPPVYFSQGPPPQGIMPQQNLHPQYQHSPPTHVMHSPQGQPQPHHQPYYHHQQHPGSTSQGPPHQYQGGPQPVASGLQLVVHNLPWSCTLSQLKDHFNDYKPERAEVVLDNFGRSRGFGIVRFLNVKDAETACESLNNSSMEGRVISVRPDRYA